MKNRVTFKETELKTANNRKKDEETSESTDGKPSVVNRWESLLSDSSLYPNFRIDIALSEGSTSNSLSTSLFNDAIRYLEAYQGWENIRANDFHVWQQIVETKVIISDEHPNITDHQQDEKGNTGVRPRACTNPAEWLQWENRHTGERYALREKPIQDLLIRVLDVPRVAATPTVGTTTNKRKKTEADSEQKQTKSNWKKASRSSKSVAFLNFHSYTRQRETEPDALGGSYSDQQKRCRLRQRRTFDWGQLAHIHCDLLSDFARTLNTKIKQRLIHVEIPNFNQQNVKLLQNEFVGFLQVLKAFFSDRERLKIQGKDQIERAPLSSSLVATSSSVGQSHSKFRELAPTVQALLPLLAFWSTHKDHELEGRLGVFRSGSSITKSNGVTRGNDSSTTAGSSNDITQTTNKVITRKRLRKEEVAMQFVPGVSRKHFFWLLRKMDRYPYWSNLTECKKWTDETDIYWGNLRGTKTRHTSLSCPMIYMVKQAVNTVDVHCGNRVWSVRFSLKSETVVPTRGGLTTPPTLYRVKRRRSFIYHHLFKYDFTIVAEGQSDEDAINGKRPKHYEVEIELLHNPATSEDMATLQIFALKFLIKLLQLLDEPSAKHSLAQSSEEDESASFATKFANYHLTPVFTEGSASFRSSIQAS